MVCLSLFGFLINRCAGALVGEHLKAKNVLSFRDVWTHIP
jgi:hypothetical protein